MFHGIRTDTRYFPLAQLSPGRTCRRLVTHRIYTPQAGRAALSYPRHLSQARVSSSKKNRESLVFRPASAGHQEDGSQSEESLTLFGRMPARLDTMSSHTYLLAGKIPGRCLDWLRHKEQGPRRELAAAYHPLISAIQYVCRRSGRSPA
jgi:hypothetical protein